MSLFCLLRPLVEVSRVLTGFSPRVSVSGYVCEGLEGSGGFQVSVVSALATIGAGIDFASPGFRWVGCFPATVFLGLKPFFSHGRSKPV